MIYPECTVDCTAEPECGVCHKPKGLRGRSYPIAMANSRCDYDCPGYSAEPQAGHIWPEEWRDHDRGDHRYCGECGQTTWRCGRCSDEWPRCECDGGPVREPLTDNTGCDV